MKKTIFLSLSLLILSFTAFSQVTVNVDSLPASPSDFTSAVDIKEVPKIWIDNYGNYHQYLGKDRKIQLTWNDNSDNEAYYLLTRYNGFDSEEWILLPNTETYLDSLYIYRDRLYNYMLQAFDEFGQSHEAVITSISIPWEPLPAPPENVTATGTSPFRFRVSFTDRSDNENGFTIFSSTEPDPMFYSSSRDWTIGTVAGTGEVVNVDVAGEFIPGQTYYITVRAFYNDDDPGYYPYPKYGDYSEIITLTIPGPEYLLAQQEENNVRLSWSSYPDDSGSGSIFLSRSENGGENSIFLFQPFNDTTFVDTTAMFNVPYVYTLKAQSDASNEYNLVTASITIHKTLEAPVATQATFVTPTSFIANWEAVPHADYYKLFVININDSTIVRSYDGLQVNGTSLIVNGLKPWKRYAYFVKSVMGDQTSAKSNVVRATAIKRLTFLTTCSNDPAHYRSWKIINPNKIPVKVWWQVNNTSQQGSMMASVGESFFSTETIRGVNKTTLTWYDDKLMSNSSTKTASTKRCVVDSTARVSASDFVTTSEDPFHLNLYPNPSSGKFNVVITSANDDDVNIEITNLLGHKILGTTIRGNNTVEIDGSSYKAGFYIVKAYHHNFCKSIKLIKQ